LQPLPQGERSAVDEDQTTQALELPTILDHLLLCLSRWKEIYEKEGFHSIRTVWLTHAQKGNLSVRLPDGTVAGEFAGLDDHGNLLLQLADGSKKAIAVGDVFFNS